MGNNQQKKISDASGPISNDSTKKCNGKIKNQDKVMKYAMYI